MALEPIEITVRFFAYYINDESEIDIKEISERLFAALNDYPVKYERNTTNLNGCRQICLTRDNINSPLEREL